MQDVFHSATHWLQACGIFYKLENDVLNAKPFIPLPKQRLNEALKPVQLMMVFLLLAFGIALGILAFMVELMVGVKTKKDKGKKGRGKVVGPNQGMIIYPNAR